MIRLSLILTAGLALTACAAGPAPGGFNQFQPRPGQGQYIRPAYLNPQPTPRVPPTDACRSQLYQGLLNQHEGSIVIPHLPGRTRVIKPASLEGFGYGPEDFFFDAPPLVEVTEYLPGQSLYAPSISNLLDRFNLGPDNENRLTIELDDAGYIQEVACG